MDRQLRTCARLTELALSLAEAAAACALLDLTPPQPEPEPAEAPAPTTQTSKQIRATAPTLRIPTCKPVCPALLFTRLATTARECMAMENQIAAGPAQKSAPSTATPHADPRRIPLIEGFSLLTEHLSNRSDLRREAIARLDAELIADPTQIMDLPTLLFSICDKAGIPLDFALLPDKYLGPLPDPDPP